MSVEKGYIVILPFMVKELNLKGNNLIVFAIIYGFCQDGSSSFYGSLSYLSKRTGLSRRSIIYILERLTKRGLISRESKRIGDKIHPIYSVCKTYANSAKATQNNAKLAPQGSAKTAPNNKYINNKVENRDQFEIFWSEYPRKIGKKEAKISFSKLNLTDELFETIMKAVELQTKSEQWQSEIFIPNPANWLNQERWNDEVGIVKNNKQNGSCEIFTLGDYA